MYVCVFKHHISCQAFLPVVRGVDYSAADPLTVTFPAGTTSSGATACADVGIIDDQVLEGNHFFTVEISSLEPEQGGMYSGLTIGMPSSAPVNIVDNEGTIT